jgi:hypothetical protein
LIPLGGITPGNSRGYKRTPTLDAMQLASGKRAALGRLLHWPLDVEAALTASPHPATCVYEDRWLREVNYVPKKNISRRQFIFTE